MAFNFQYGGQAVIEGVMMRGPSGRAVAVRLPGGGIAVDEKQVGSITKRYPFLKWPLLRGVVALLESLLIGIEALNYSASKALGEEEELSKTEIVLTIGFALALAVVLFVIVPTGAAHLLKNLFQSSLAQNLVEGVLRLVVFLLYVVLIGRLEDIKRVFQYHGAEHKVINAYEAGHELTVEKVQRFSTFHPRCGTSFLLIVLVLSIFLFASLGHQVLWWRITSRILLLPVLAGISYEALKLSARYAENFLCRLLITPGRWLQALTTGEPDDSQVEVAISAFDAVLKESETQVQC
ncbi:MAG: membrane protein [Peptococcaceae bacterium BRH_c4a]|nr:MAG: membrane protein [Peptococcaceae bacterium BRH_c4a]